MEWSLGVPRHQVTLYMDPKFTCRCDLQLQLNLLNLLPPPLKLLWRCCSDEAISPTPHSTIGFTQSHLLPRGGVIWDPGGEKAHLHLPERLNLNE